MQPPFGPRVLEKPGNIYHGCLASSAFKLKPRHEVLPLLLQIRTVSVRVLAGFTQRIVRVRITVGFNASQFTMPLLLPHALVSRYCMVSAGTCRAHCTCPRSLRPPFSQRTIKIRNTASTTKTTFVPRPGYPRLPVSHTSVSWDRFLHCTLVLR